MDTPEAFLGVVNVAQRWRKIIMEARCDKDGVSGATILRLDKLLFDCEAIHVRYFTSVVSSSYAGNPAQRASSQAYSAVKIPCSSVEKVWTRLLDGPFCGASIFLFVI
jgi:hypothetical protein